MHEVISREKGFTLAELVIVIIILGILSTFVFRTIGVGVMSSARSQSLIVTSKKAIDNWISFTKTAGLPLSPSEISPITSGIQNNNDILKIVFLGRGSVPNDYKRAWDQSKLEPLIDAINYDGTNFVIEDKFNMDLTFVSNGAAERIRNFGIELTPANDKIPQEVVKEINTKTYGSNADFPSPSRTKGTFHYSGCGTNGCDSMTFYRYWKE